MKSYKLPAFDLTQFMTKYAWECTSGQIQNFQNTFDSTVLAPVFAHPMSSRIRGRYFHRRPLKKHRQPLNNVSNAVLFSRYSKKDVIYCFLIMILPI